MAARTRILIIDDDPSVTDFLRRGLTYEGYQVDVASSGKAGLGSAREQPPDVVVLDIMMPGMDGLEVCRRLRAASAAPVLMLTARDAVSDKVLGLETGADDYLIKPFAFEELLARIRALLRAAFLPVQALDGFRNTTDNVRGVLPAFFITAGFRDVREETRVTTALGSISLYTATRPAAGAE